ncbi:MAG: hypothetical protein CL921_07790 [Deltaproteobacteria bacterium]|nr:hypothetical protein [Deltaproteobacteria bacterium]
MCEPQRKNGFLEMAKNHEFRKVSLPKESQVLYFYQTVLLFNFTISDFTLIRFGEPPSLAPERPRRQR